MDNKLRLADRSPCRRPTVFTSQWDSLEPNTEKNLAQESKQHLQMHAGEYMLSQGKMSGILKEEDCGDAVADDTNESDLDEVAAQSHTREPVIRTHRSHLDANDSYSQLCCDPNEKGEAILSESLKSSAQEHHHFSRQKSSPLQKPFIRGYKYITDTSSVVVMTPNISSNHCQPYHLHPQDDPVSAIKSQHYHKALGHGSPKHSSCNISTKADRDRTSHRQFKDPLQNGCDADENINRSLERTEHSIYLKEYHTDNQKEVGGGGGFFPISPTTESPKTLRKKKRHKQTEDLVQRNKITLGRSASGHGSYVSMHALKQKKPHGVKELHETAEEGLTAQCPKDSSDPELRLIQKTHQLKVTPFTEGSNARGTMDPYYRSMDKSSECAASLKCQFCVTESEQRWCQEDVLVKQSFENVSNMPSSTSHSTGADTKLPPIRSKLCPSHIAKATDTLHSHGFDGYLAQTDHQTRTKPNYKNTLAPRTVAIQHSRPLKFADFW
ncbi:jhy protein homolog isoform X2 [Dunckerocampus dactyliophorus]|uniref:jhy protein homolog isoform X2 n=1 Tax=Dunckerocampus dactyliophorus TaxID=161453 RepID=UPI002406B253|nr:jhy protein homolog isoform X2 [Dunckerocampus dactyliophorus]